MRIRKLEVENFRALRKTEITFNETTAIIGENNSGKSAFLVALDIFFQAAPQIREKDFSDGNTSEDISITIHFCDLTPHDIQEFKSNLIDGHLIVTRKFKNNNAAENGRYFVSAKVNPEFTECRQETGKTRKRELYEKLREKYGDELPKEKNADEIDGYLEAYEENHPETLETTKVGSFKGFKNVAAGKLREKTDYIFVRASQDAAHDFHQNKASPVKILINTIAKQTIENNEDYKNFIDNANKEIAQLTDPDNVPLLSEISGDLTEILQTYYKNSEINTTWQPVTSIQPTFPTSEIEVKDKEFTTSIDGVGHGLQRAIILTVLQYMSNRRNNADKETTFFSEAQSDIIIAIEEPEIYQHPIKQRLFAKVLNTISQKFNEKTGIRVQSIFVTHSPLLVSLPLCHNIRVVRYNPKAGKNTVVSETTLKKCAERLALINGSDIDSAWSSEKLSSRLHTFRGEITEGFFGECVVLVEGVGDKAIIDAYYSFKGYDPHAEGIVIAEVSGKANLAKTVTIFSELGIPCFWLFDNDKDEKDKPKDQVVLENKALQCIGGIEFEKCVDFPEGSFGTFSAWNGKIEEYVKSCAKEKFEPARKIVSNSFDVPEKDCLKSPAPAAELFRILIDEKVVFTELDAILAQIESLRYK